MYTYKYVVCVQPSDRNCPCSAGYRTMAGREQDCVKHVYDLCGATQIRTQHGLCWTQEQWDSYCIEKVRELRRHILIRAIFWNFFII